MAVVITQATSHPSVWANVGPIATALTAAQAASSVGGSVNALSNAAMVKSLQEALVFACLDFGRLQPASVISTCGIPNESTAGAGPNAGGSNTPAALIASLNTLKSNNPLMNNSGAIDQQILDLQIAQIADAIAIGQPTNLASGVRYNGAASILNQMS